MTEGALPAVVHRDALSRGVPEMFWWCDDMSGWADNMSGSEAQMHVGEVQMNVGLVQMNVGLVQMNVGARQVSVGRVPTSRRLLRGLVGVLQMVSAELSIQCGDATDLQSAAEVHSALVRARNAIPSRTSSVLTYLRANCRYRRLLWPTIQAAVR